MTRPDNPYPSNSQFLLGILFIFILIFVVGFFDEVTRKNNTWNIENIVNNTQEK